MKKQRSQQGFTLVELILVIVIMGVISVIVGKILFQSFKTFIASQNISDIAWQSFLPMQDIANDVHSIRSANDIITISATNFSFVNMAGTTITYQLTGSVLTRNSQTLANGVQSLTFGYRNENYAVTTVPANVRYITISASFNQGNLTLPFTTMIGTRGMP